MADCRLHCYRSCWLPRSGCELFVLTVIKAGEPLKPDLKAKPHCNKRQPFLDPREREREVIHSALALMVDWSSLRQAFGMRVRRCLDLFLLWLTVDIRTVTSSLH